MCEICRISGRNIFADADVEHNVNEDAEDLGPHTLETWYVWRRGDGFVGITNVEPTEFFTDEYAYYTLLITTSHDHAIFEAMQARLCN